MGEVFIPITLFSATAFVLFFFFRYRYLERQAIIEKGISGEELKEMFKKHPKQKTKNDANLAKWGIILIAIGLAILIGTQFSDEVMLALIFIFPGIGLLLFYKFILKNEMSTGE